MPVFPRSTLRQNLGLNVLHDTTVGNTSSSWGALGSVAILDKTQANVAFTGEQLFNRAWVKVNSMTLRVASFNVASGAYISAQLALTVVPSGAQYETHQLISPDDKDRCLNDTITRLRFRQEVGFPSQQNAEYYALDGTASPNTISEVLNAYYFNNASGTINRDRSNFDWWGVVQTATGPELRTTPILGASQQIILDAVLVPTLGAADAATVFIPGPGDRFVLVGAAAKAYDLILRNAVGQEMQKFKDLRAEVAHEFTVLSSRYRPTIDRKVEFDEPLVGNGWGGAGNGWNGWWAGW